MNDEQKQQYPAAPSEAGERSKRRNRRRHKGGKRPENREAQNGPRQNEQTPSSAANENPQNRPSGNRQPEAADGQNVRPQQANGTGGKKRNRRDRRHGKKDRSRGVDDLYGTPTEADSLSLDELRAKIVVQSADGSKPVVDSPSFAGEPVSTDPAGASSASEALPEVDPDLLSAMPDILLPPEIPAAERAEVIGVRFRGAAKAYYFDPKGKKVHVGDSVIVDTARGSEFGEVAFANRIINKKILSTPLRPLIRAASGEDIARNEANRAKEREAADIFYKKMREHRLVMKLIDVQFAFDNSKLLFYFTSEGRVDFRELVRDLAGVFRTRIELRQIGIRDEARLLGGLGVCGRPLCCSSFLSDFAQVSIKMAKEQGLSLNSAKISGACGRLMCCLHYETESYAQEIRLTPPVGATVRTPDGIGEVIGNNPIAATVRVSLKDQDAPKQYSRDDVTVIARDPALKNGQPANES